MERERAVLGESTESSADAAREVRDRLITRDSNGGDGAGEEGAVLAARLLPASPTPAPSSSAS